MSYVLNVCYAALLLFLSPVLLYSAVRHGKYRSGWREKVWGLVPQGDPARRRIWFHAVSVGEVNLLLPLFQELKRELPEWECVLSTTTRTGMEVARKRYPQLTLFYCPLDFSWAVRRAMRRVRPDFFVLTELEIWPNLVKAARENGARVALINGRLSERSFRGYQRLGRLLRPTLNRIDLIATQTPTYAERFIALRGHSTGVFVTGSMKFDGAEQDRLNPKTRSLRRLAGIDESDCVLLAGSTQAPEEQLALETFQELHEEFPELRLILVPRHPERFEEVAQLLRDAHVAWSRRSELAPQGSAAERIVLVDTVGELSAWWGVAQIAFVGGSIDRPRGGQNMIEPAAYGAAVCFGPHTSNFRDVVSQLLEREAAVVVQTGSVLTQFSRRCLRDEGWRETRGARAAQVVREQQGATVETVRLLASQLEAQGGREGLSDAALLRRLKSPSAPAHRRCG